MATNPWFRSAFSAIPGSRAQQRPVDFDLEQIEFAFDSVYELLTAITGGPTWIGSKPDVPLSYAGAAYRVPRVNPAQSAIEFVKWGRMQKIVVTTSRALTDADFGAVLICDSASPITLTMPLNSTTPIDVESSLVAVQWGAGKVTVAPAAGVTLRSVGALASTRAQFAQLTVYKTDTNEILLGGDLAA